MALDGCMKHYFHSLRKQSTFRDAIAGFPAKRRLRNERRNSMLMTRHYVEFRSASDWLKQISEEVRPIRSTTQNVVVTRHQHGNCALASQTSFLGETSGGVAKSRMFSHATNKQSPNRAVGHTCSHTQEHVSCENAKLIIKHCLKS